MRHDDNSAGYVIQSDAPQRCLCKLQIMVQTFLRRAQQNHSGVRARRVVPQIGKLLVGGDEPAVLCLGTPPKFVVSHPPPTLIQHRNRVVALRIHKIGDFSGQILIDFQPSDHY